MKKNIVALVLAAASCAAFAQTPSGDAARGKSLFMKNICWSCHGTEGHGEPYGPKLAPNPMPWEAFAHQVRQPRGTMPHYAPQFVSDRDLADIYAYVAAIPAGKKASDIPLLK